MVIMEKERNRNMKRIGTKTMIWVVVLSVAILTISCKHDSHCYTPIGASNCAIEPNSPLYNHLNNVGGYEYIVGGNHGIFVVRTSLNEFVAYERTCPHDHDVAVEVMEGWDGAVLQCPKCGSKFNTYADGVPLDGSATSCALYEYGTTYDNGTLYIY